MTMMIMQWKICKENDFMSFCAKVDFLGQGLTFGQLLTFVDFFSKFFECMKKKHILYGAKLGYDKLK
jgi:hypothetical protein